MTNEHVSKSYDNGRTIVVNNIQLQAACGELFALLGESGSGKTTLLKLGGE